MFEALGNAAVNAAFEARIHEARGVATRDDIFSQALMAADDMVASREGSADPEEASGWQLTPKSSSAVAHTGEVPAGEQAISAA